MRSSQRKPSKMPSIEPATVRARSVSSMRNRKRPPLLAASARSITACSAVPMCGKPVGLGATRVTSAPSASAERGGKSASKSGSVMWSENGISGWLRSRSRTHLVTCRLAERFGRAAKINLGDVGRTVEHTLVRRNCARRTAAGKETRGGPSQSPAGPACRRVCLILRIVSYTRGCPLRLRTRRRCSRVLFGAGRAAPTAALRDRRECLTIIASPQCTSMRLRSRS